MLALDPGGPSALAPRPAPDRESGQIQVDRIDPAHLNTAIRTLHGQWAVLTSRTDRQGGLVYRRSSGGEERLNLKALRRSAADADVNLIVLSATAPRQPGARNWLWLAVEVDGLAAARKAETFGEFLQGLAAAQGRCSSMWRAARPAARRLTIKALPASEPDLFNAMLAELASEVTGTVVPHALEADLIARPRALELGQRLLPGVPSSVQFGFAGLLALGLICLPIALSWWREIWPPEERAVYPSAFGYRTAQFVTLVFFFAVFVPIAAIPALLWGLMRAAMTGVGRVTRADTKPT